MQIKMCLQSGHSNIKHVSIGIMSTMESIATFAATEHHDYRLPPITKLSGGLFLALTVISLLYM